jgi:hypothetical protein
MKFGKFSFLILPIHATCLAYLIQRDVCTLMMCGELIHSPAPCCGTIASVAFIPWRVKQAANKPCWLASMCKYNTQGSYS